MNNKKTKISYALILLFGVTILTLIDQWTKALAVEYLKGQTSIKMIPGVFELQYLENTGAAFGILNNQQWLFYITTILLVIVLLWLYFKLPMSKYFRPIHILLIFIIAGAFGNFIDRACNQYVIDFFYFSLIDFPIFNVADIYVTVCVGLLFVLILFRYKEEDFDLLFKSSKH